MKNEKKEFIEEFTDKFSELCVESFCLNFLASYDPNDLLESVKEVNMVLNKKLKKNWLKKLKKLGYSSEYLNFLK